MPPFLQRNPSLSRTRYQKRNKERIKGREIRKDKGERIK